MSEHAKDPLDGRALVEALEALRPERDAFRGGVEGRIAAGEERERERAAEIALSPFLRTAAALLPVSFLPKGLASGATAIWTPRTLLLLVVWPALTFAMLLLPFWMAFSSLGAQEGRPDERRRAALGSWWRAHLRGASVTLAVVAALFWLEPAGGAAALMMVSAGALALLLARLRAAGFGERREVGRNCAFFLGMCLLFTPWGLFRGMLLVDPAVADGCWTLLALGAAACAFLALAAVHRSPWSWLVRSTGLEASLGFGVLLIGVYLAAMAVLSLGFGVSMHEATHGQDPRARLIVHLESRLPRAARPEWTLAADVGAWLREVGRSPDLGSLRARWNEALTSGEPPSGAFLAAGLRLGLAGEDEIVPLLPTGLLELERGRSGPLLEPIPRESPVTLLLVRESAGTAGEGARMRERLLASFHAHGEPWALRRAADVAWLLEELEPGSSAELRAPARELLAASWIPAGIIRGAGFQAPGGPGPRVPMIADSHAAIDLLARFGAPGNVDLRHLEQALQKDSRRPLSWMLFSSEHVEAWLALGKLRAHLGTQRSLPHPQDLALLLACALLAALCVAATLRAPRPRIEAGPLAAGSDQ